MEANSKWLLFAIPVMLVAPAVSSEPLAQSEYPSTTQNVPARPSNADDDWTRAPKLLQTANSWRRWLSTQARTLSVGKMHCRKGYRLVALINSSAYYELSYLPLRQRIFSLGSTKSVTECHGLTLLSMHYSFRIRTCRSKRLLL